ncbi:MAG: glycerol-3-phosphate acyltransferase [Actinobacteria bacterium]|nr:glycerol-3-phosphate acyltransferase [Actinomycetota bacterium]
MELIEIFRDMGFIVSSFLIGSIPFCYVLGKIVGKKKLTEIGDRNPGGWNLVFNVSKIWGFIGILLDMAKGFFSYYLTLMFAYKSSTIIFGTNHNELLAVLAGCAAVAGHCYSPFLRWNGGKGLATWGGFAIAASFYSLPVGGLAILAGLLIARNMIWAVSMGIIFTGIFLWIYTGAAVFLLSIIILLIIMLPRQVNRNLALGKNFKFRKEATLGDLFKPRIR